MESDATSSGDVILETSRLVLRPWQVSEAAVMRELWTERDPRVPPHRRIDADGHPTLAGATVWDWNLASRRVLAKAGFSETKREEMDPVRGITLFTARQL